MSPSTMWLRVVSSIIIVSTLLVISSQAAPTYIKKSYNKHHKNASDKRSERRLLPHSSPIHFINPFMSLPPALNTFSNFLSPSAPSLETPVSPIFRLPLRIMSNAKPYGVLPGLPQDHFMDMLPHAMSKIIRLPLKFMSNAKPVGIYFKNPGINFI